VTESPATVEAYFADTGLVSVPCHEGSAVAPGSRLDGPAIIREPTTTIVVYPGSSAFVTPLGNYLLEVMQERIAPSAARGAALAR
jgi:N-methylhydantoinase A